MEIIIYSLPFIISITLLIFFKKYIVWWEYILLIGSSILFTACLEGIMIRAREFDIEYHGGYITKITHYDEWDEWVERTCTRTVHDGYDDDGNEITHEETYDCSYRDYHPERWTYTDNYGREEYFCYESEFNRAMDELGHPKMVFRDMHRDYYKIDGDAQDYFYDGTIEHIRPLTWSHSYQNKIIASNSIFKFEEIEDEEAKKLGLFNYPKIKDYDQDAILGVNLGKKIHKKIKYINAIYGKTKQIRVYILVYTDKPLEISEQQKAYWQGGNKNEFIVCLGYNSKTKRVDWCNPFSWCDEPVLEVETKRFFMGSPHIVTSVDSYASWLKANLHLWKRKEFKDFDYIDNTLTKGQAIALLILVLIFDVVMSIFCIGNECRNEDLCDSVFLYVVKDIQRILMNKLSILFTTAINKITIGFTFIKNYFNKNIGRI